QLVSERDQTIAADYIDRTTPDPEEGQFRVNVVMFEMRSRSEELLEQALAEVATLPLATSIEKAITTFWEAHLEFIEAIQSGKEPPYVRYGQAWDGLKRYSQVIRGSSSQAPVIASSSPEQEEPANPITEKMMEAIAVVAGTESVKMLAIARDHSKTV